MELTKAQKATLKEVLTTFLENEADVLNHAFNYDLERKEIRVRATQMINVAIIMEQALGVKGAIKKFAPTEEDIQAYIGNVE